MAGAMYMDVRNRAHRKAKGKSGIHIKESHKGMLHEDLGVEQGEPISVEKLEEAKNSKSPAVRRRATFALNARSWHH